MFERKKKIMIVDDSAVIHSLLKNILKDVRCTVIDAFNSTDAFEKFDKELPDIILMDIIMERQLSGVDVLKDIKMHSPNTVVIMVTSLRKNEDVIKQCVEAGADEYISKPFNREDILSALKPYL